MTYITGGAVQLSGTTSLIDLPGISAPSLSAASHGRIYFDSGTNTFKMSLNGGSYSTLGISYTAGTGLTLSGTQFSLTTPVSVANGGTGTATPGLIAGTNISSITGTWPNQTINAANQTTTPAGSNTQVQFNNSGAFGGSAGLTWDGTNLAATAFVSNTYKATSGAIALQPGTDSSSAFNFKTAGGVSMVQFDTSVHRVDFINAGGVGDILIDPNGSRLVMSSTGAGADSTIYMNVTSGGSWYLNSNGNASGIGGGTGAFAIYHNSNTTTPFYINSSDVTNITSLTLSNPLPVASGGSGTASPSLVAGSGISVTGSWPNQTITNTSSGGFSTAGFGLTSASSTVSWNPNFTNAQSNFDSGGTTYVTGIAPSITITTGKVLLVGNVSLSFTASAGGAISARVRIDRDGGGAFNGNVNYILIPAGMGSGANVIIPCAFGVIDTGASANATHTYRIAINMFTGSLATTAANSVSLVAIEI